MNDHSGRRSQDTVHHHRGRELSSVDRVPNTSPDESRAGLLQVGREGTGAGLQGGQGSTLHTAQPLCCLQPRQEPGTQSLSFLSWLAWLTSRQGKKSHSFTAKAGRLCSDGQERCLLYPDTINAVLVT